MSATNVAKPFIKRMATVTANWRLDRVAAPIPPRAEATGFLGGSDGCGLLAISL
jgi:hypothetical protein